MSWRNVHDPPFDFSERKPIDIEHYRMDKQRYEDVKDNSSFYLALMHPNAYALRISNAHATIFD